MRKYNLNHLNGGLFAFFNLFFKRIFVNFIEIN